MAIKIAESIVESMASAVEFAAGISLGQSFLKLCDRFLWVIEKSTQWSLPMQEITVEENGKVFGQKELVRPLPWVLFIPGLIILRAIRTILNVGSFILGYPEVQPTRMVQFIQKSRKQLRTIKTNGLKTIRQRKLGIESETAVSKEKSVVDSATSPMQVGTKRTYSRYSSDESDGGEKDILQSIIAHLAVESDENDPDFDVENCSSTTATSDENVSLHEVADLLEDAKNPNIFPDPKDLEEYVQQRNTVADIACDASDEKIGFGRSECGRLTPNKLGIDNEPGVFYSPISSKSTSPERLVSPTDLEILLSPSDNSTPKDVGNGKLNSNTVSSNGISEEEFGFIDGNGFINSERNE
ncbi:uncharacterized protein LOC105697811 isoform X2 [Orussus abietinus]|uniref:uncharacterized protein LOC105697811 isoform X2 n=1 Tax=Orussus abietinus TaxID=222816 RepID=UPI000626D6BB|nr:uncharacterized protein LOC105697811 isoform X2 [Orussus abietinus]